MGRIKLSVGSRKSTRPVVLHLDRAVAHDLLQALTQALEPHSTNLGKLKKSELKGRPLKGMSLKAKSVKGKSSKGKGPKGKSTKGKRSEKSR